MLPVLHIILISMEFTSIDWQPTCTIAKYKPLLLWFKVGPSITFLLNSPVVAMGTFPDINAGGTGGPMSLTWYWFKTAASEFHLAKAERYRNVLPFTVNVLPCLIQVWHKLNFCLDLLYVCPALVLALSWFIAFLKTSFMSSSSVIFTVIFWIKIALIRLDLN